MILWIFTVPEKFWNCRLKFKKNILMHARKQSNHSFPAILSSVLLAFPALLMNSCFSSDKFLCLSRTVKVATHKIFSACSKVYVLLLHLRPIPLQFAFGRRKRLFSSIICSEIKFALTPLREYKNTFCLFKLYCGGKGETFSKSCFEE